MPSIDVVTMYFCGSGNNKQQSDEYTLPLFYEKTKGSRKAIFNGPGGGPIQKTEAITKMLANGGSASTGFALTKKGKAANQAAKWQKMLNSYHGTMTTGGTGVGTQSNIVMALQWLWLQYYEQPFTKVNLAGFSRGGVSAIMLGHAIQAAGFTELGNIEVNIFAFDPVPGGLNDFKNKGSFEATGRAGTPDTLAPVVSSYRSILQENLKKWMKVFGPIHIKKDKNFKCVVPNYKGSNKKRTPRELIPMPGGHGESARHDNDKGPGAIGAHLLQEFMEAHGTEYSANYKLTPKQIVEAYASTRLCYTEGDEAFGDKKAASKHRVNLVTNPFRSHPFFVNAQHATLIYENYPKVAKLIDDGEDLEKADRTRLASALPTTFSCLTNLGYLK